MRRRAKELGLVDAEVARRAGIEQRTYANYVLDKRFPKLNFLLKIAEVLETTPNELFGVRAHELNDIANECFHDAFCRRVGRGAGKVGVADLADAIDVQAHTVKAWRDGDTLPQLTEMLRLCAFFGSAFASELLAPAGLGGVERVELADPDLQGTAVELVETADLTVDNALPGPEIVQYLPLISWVRAGEWTEIEDTHEQGTYEKLIPVTKRYSNRAYALKLTGDSMQALDGDSFPTGSIICVEPQRPANNGSYVVIRLESSNEATFKQLVIDGDRRFLKPLNPRYPIMEITEPTTICGVVRQLVMDFDR